MFTKALIFVFLCTGLVLAKSFNEEIAEQQHVDKTWGEKVSEFLHKIEDVFVKYYNKGIESLKKVVNILKVKSKEIAESVKEKWAKLNQDYQEIKDKVYKAIKKQKQVFQQMVQELKQKGNSAAEKVKDYANNARDLLKEEYAKFEANLREWLQKVKNAIAEARGAFQKKSFEDILNDISEKFGDLAGKERLIELKNNYYELKKQSKVAIEMKKQEITGKLEELKETAPKKYQIMKGEVPEILFAEKIKWDLKINAVKEQIQAIIKEIKNKIGQ